MAETDIRLLGAFAELRKTTSIFVMSVCPSAWYNSAPTGRVFMRFDIFVFFENMSRNLKIHENLTRMTGALQEGVC